jgi:hypothetical protein
VAHFTPLYIGVMPSPNIYKTNRMLVSIEIFSSESIISSLMVEARLTQWMTTTQLRFLSVLCGKLVTNAVQQLDVRLLRVLLHGSYESPGHSTSGLCRNSRISPVTNVSLHLFKSALEVNAEQSSDIGFADPT